MLLARDSIVRIIIPSSISLPTSLFTRSVILYPATNSLVTMLASLGVMSITERAQRYLSETRSDKSESLFMPTQQTPNNLNLLTRSVILHPATNSLVTLLARLGVMSITERAQRYLSETRSDKSYLDKCQTNKYLRKHL